MTLTGDTRLVELFAKAGAAAPGALLRATYESAHLVLADSQEIVPVDTGALRASGQVHLPAVSGTNVEVVVGYGGPGVDYATYVHEDLSAHHAPGTSAKFLEIAVTRRTNGWQDAIAARVQDLLR